MEIRAISKSVRVSPRKVRLVADAIRHLSIEEALKLLEATPKRAARPLTKTLQSAIANAVNNAKLEKSDLVIGSIMVNQSQALKRFRPSTRGRIHPYKKRGSTITIVVKSVSAVVSSVKPDVEEAVIVEKSAEKKLALAKKTAEKGGNK